jgi:hypothetical protein
MAILIIFGAIALALVVLDLVALTHGADSRPDFADDRWPGGYRTF